LIQNLCYGVILLLFSTGAMASDKKVTFLKKLEMAEGNYQVSKGSNKNCQEGMLTGVKGSFKNGFRLGQQIYFGPMNEKMEKETKTSCRVENKFKYDANQITQITELSRCPGEFKKDEGTSTSVLTINGSQVNYTIQESGFKCTFKKLKVRK
jgi:hypothetical protein